MKNEELLDLITELKIDDRFIEEAISDDLDGRSPVKAYAGNVKRSPMRIIAPVAACLAVIVGAGFVLANVNGAKKAPIAPADVSASASSESVSAETVDFTEQCKAYLIEQNASIASAPVDWETGAFDVDFDGEDELLLYPTRDGMTIDDVGVCVFKKTAEGSFAALGTFGKGADSIDLNDIRKDERDDAEEQYYFCMTHDREDGLYKGVCFVSYNEEENKVSDEKSLLFVNEVRENNKICEGSMTDGKYSGSEQYFFIKMREFPDDIAEKYVEFTNAEIAKCENDALTRNGKLDLAEYLTPRMWHAGEYDINGDGEKELLISLFNFTNMKGVFVYDKNCEYIGSFETENNLCDPELIYLYDRDGEKYWYYLGVGGSTVRTGSEYATRLDRTSINRINVENNSFSTERLMHCDLVWDKKAYDVVDHYVYWIGDREVTEEEYRKAEKYYCLTGMGSHDFDLTDPAEWEYSGMFEDSVLTGADKGWSGDPDILNKMRSANANN